MKRILGLILALTVIISMSNVSVSADKAENLANRNFEILKYLLTNRVFYIIILL